MNPEFRTGNGAARYRELQTREVQIEALAKHLKRKLVGQLHTMDFAKTLRFVRSYAAFGLVAVPMNAPQFAQARKLACCLQFDLLHLWTSKSQKGCDLVQQHRPEGCKVEGAGRWQGAGEFLEVLRRPILYPRAVFEQREPTAI